MQANPGVQLPSDISIAELIRHEHNSVATRYVIVANVALLLYEYSLTFNIEVAYIWSSRPLLTVTNVLFCVIRYLPMARAIGHAYFSLNPPIYPRSCTRATDFNSWATMISVAVVEILMLLRAWAVWGRRKSVGIILVAFWICALGGTVAVVKTPLPPIPNVVPLPPIIAVPCDRPSPYKYVASYCITLLFEFVSFLFMFGRVALISKGIRREIPVLQALQIQGAYYFLAVISIMSFVVGSAYSEKLARPVVFSGLAPTITSIACTRVILALRGVFLNPSTISPRLSGGSSSYTNTAATADSDVPLSDFSGRKDFPGKSRGGRRHKPLPLTLESSGGDIDTMFTGTYYTGTNYRVDLNDDVTQFTEMTDFTTGVLNSVGILSPNEARLEEGQAQYPSNLQSPQLSGGLSGGYTSPAASLSLRPPSQMTLTWSPDVERQLNRGKSSTRDLRGWRQGTSDNRVQLTRGDGVG